MNTDLSTIAGSSTIGFANGFGAQARFYLPSGIYFDSSSKNLIIADNGNYAIRKMNQSGFIFSLSLSLSWISPKSFESLSQTYSWTNNNNNNNKGYVSTIAGSGTSGTNDGQGTLAQFSEPYCVTMDSIGNIYVGDDCAIRMINSTGLFWWDGSTIWYR